MKKKTEKKKKKQDIIKNYDLTSDFYDKRYLKIQQEKYQLVFTNFKIKDQIILDAGCGTGLLFNYLLNSFNQDFFVNYHYIATDISYNMLNKFHYKLNQKIPRFRKRVHLLISDLDHLPFRKNICHVLFSFTSLQNLPDIFQGIDKSFRVVKPEANMVFSVLKKNLDLKGIQLRLHPYLKNIEIINNDFIEDIIFKGQALKE